MPVNRPPLFWNLNVDPGMPVSEWAANGATKLVTLLVCLCPFIYHFTLLSFSGECTSVGSKNNLLLY